MKIIQSPNCKCMQPCILFGHRQEEEEKSNVTSVGGFLHEYEHRFKVGEYNDEPGH